MKKATAISFIPLLTLIALLALTISIFGDSSMAGASQVSLLVAASVSCLLATKVLGTPWNTIESGIKKDIADISIALVILFLIGGISGTWMSSGIVPTLICYGIKIISPKFFLVTACVICAIVSVMTGSSWTTIATIGVALLGIGRAEGFSDGLIAGAIISGAYFGDKVSPLSDTTVMASSLTGVELFQHIRYMTVTTGPSIIITLIIFTILGLSHSGSDQALIDTYVEVLNSTFNITPWLLIVPVIVGIMIARKLPAPVVLSASILLGAIAAAIFQPDILYHTGSIITDGSDLKVSFTGAIRTIYDSVSIETGNEAVNALVSSKGMAGMLSTVFLIICAIVFGSTMKSSGMIGNIAALMLPLTKRKTTLVGSTLFSGILFDMIVCDQYLSILMTSSIFKEIYEKEGYENRLLSRTIEESSTIFCPLVPWSTCGMTQATILSVPTIAYLPYCFFNLISPIVSLIVCATGYKIYRTVKK